MAMKREMAITIPTPVVADNNRGREARRLPPIFVSYGLMYYNHFKGVVGHVRSLLFMENEVQRRSARLQI